MLAQTDLRLSRYAPHTIMAPHVHDAATLNIVIGGHFTEQIGRRERRYAPGTVTFCPAGVVHSQTFGAGGTRQIIIRPQDAWLDYLSDCQLDLAASPYVCSATFQSLGERLLEEIRNGDAFSALACEGLMLEIFAAFGRNAMAAPAAPTPPAWLRRAQEFIREHAFTSISMARIAQAAGRHEIHLAREFRRHFGVSVGDYLRQLRTEHAALLLRQSQCDLTEIALACGFSSHAHLCRNSRPALTPRPRNIASARADAAAVEAEHALSRA
jgi:AraC family transcriptional regulator